MCVAAPEGGKDGRGEPNDVKLGRISDLKDSPFADESPLQRALEDLKQRKASEDRIDRLEALLTKTLAELAEIKAILLSVHDSVAESDEDNSV